MFRLKRPCAECPFLKQGGIRLTRARTDEVANYFINVSGRHPWTGATFPCHKTVVDVEDEDESDDARALRMDFEMCTGGIIFGLKQQEQSTAVQLGTRLFGLKTEELQGAADVVDTLDELRALSYER